MSEAGTGEQNLDRVVSPNARGPGPFPLESVNTDLFPCAVNYRAFDEPVVPRTMLSKSELQFLAWIARSVFKGAGEIVDLGTWMGGSTVALAMGFEMNRGRGQRKIHFYDTFLWYEMYQRYNLGLDLKEGDSFLNLYLDAIEPWKSLIEVNPGDIRKSQWCGLPIEILFLDLMKNPSIAQHVAAEFFPHLVPRRSFIIDQDFKFSLTPHIPIGSYRLREYLTPALNIFDAPSLVFQCSKAIPADVAREAYNMDTLTRSEVDAAYRWTFAVCRNSIPKILNQLGEAHQRAYGLVKV